MNDPLKTKPRLSLLHGQYKSGLLSKADFESRLFQHILGRQQSYRIFEGEPEKWSDFISWMYPRLSRAADRYQETGAGFSGYISAILKYGAKEYIDVERRHTLAEQIIWQAKAEEDWKYYGGEDASSLVMTAAEAPDKPVPIPLRPVVNASGKSLLMLLLKAYCFVSDDFLRRAAAGSGIDPQEALRMVNELRNMRRAADAKINRLRSAVHFQYYRCQIFEKRLARHIEGSPAYEIAERRCERARLRLFSMRERIGRMRRNASNQQIAQVMGINKSTVDAAMRKLKNRWCALMKKSPLKCKSCPVTPCPFAPGRIE